jgi:hypothetical protein
LMERQRGGRSIVPDGPQMMKFSSSQARDQAVIRPCKTPGITLEMTTEMPPRMAALHPPAHVKT